MEKRFSISRLFWVLICCIALTCGGQISTSQASSLADEIGDTIFLPIMQYHTGPRWLGPDGGSVVSLAASDDDSSIVYAGTWGGGVFKSYNGGVSWTPAYNGLGEMHIDSLAVDPDNPNIVYAGTHGAGIFKTKDGGANWFEVNTGIQDDAVVYTLTVNVGNSNLVFAGTRGAPGLSGPPWSGILYKSVDGGANWTAVLQNVGGSGQQDWVYSVRSNPNSPDEMMAATHEHGPYYSDDYGNKGTWKDDNGSADQAGRAVAYDLRSWNQSAMYATWHGGVFYLSDDNGESWSKSNSGIGSAKIYPNAIAIEPYNPTSIYMGSFADALHGVVKSEDGGETWFKSGLTSLYIYSVATPGKSKSVVLAGTLSDGVYRSSNGGGSWAHAYTGIVNSNVSGIVFTGGETLLGSTLDGGVFRSTDYGQSWYEYNPNLADRDINGLVGHPDNPNIAYALTDDTGLKRIDLSNSNGWISTGMPDNPNLSGSIEQLDDPLSRSEPIEELLGYTPTDSIPDEVANSSELEQSSSTAISAPILSMEFAPSSSLVAYVGTNGSGVYLSVDSGVTFNATGLTSGAVRSVAVHPTDPNKVYAAYNTAGLIKYSSDSGSTWNDLPLVTGSPVIYAVEVSAYNPSVVYAGTSSGVYMYNGSAWSAAGLQGAPVTSLKANPYDPIMIIAGTSVGAYQATYSNYWSLITETNGVGIQSIQFTQKNGEDYAFIGTTIRGTLEYRLD